MNGLHSEVPNESYEIDSRMRYSRTFEQEKVTLIERIGEWAGGDKVESDWLEKFESCVFVKNSQRIVVHANSAFRELIAGGALPMGVQSDGFLAKPFRRISQASDALILGGVKSLELEHIGYDSHGTECLFVTFKRRLDELRDPSLCFIGISRPLAVTSAATTGKRLSLAEQKAVFSKLDKTDQAICRLYYGGATTKSIAESVGLTPRSVEVRRQKILDEFEFSRPVEIIKLLTRLEENGLLGLIPS